MKFIKKLWGLYGQIDTAGGALTSEWLRPWVLPISAWVLTVLSGVYTSVPLPYLLCAACLSAAGISTAIVRIDDWRARSNLQGKLLIEEPIFVRDNINKDIIQFSIVLKNISSFPIEYRMNELRSMVFNRVSGDGRCHPETSIIPPNECRYYRDKTIDVSGHELYVFDAFMTFNLDYGHLGHLKNNLRGKVTKRITMIPNTNTHVSSFSFENTGN